MEHWKPIPGYEGIYDASDDGKIRSAPNKVTSNALYERRVWKSRIMRQKITRNARGRYDARVCLWKDGKEHTYLVARLVAMAWCDGYSDGLTVNHIDGNPLNNNANNLEWVTLKENIALGFETGLYDSFTKKVKLIDKNGSEQSFNSMSSASRYLGRNHGYISLIVQNNRMAKSAISGESFSVCVQ